LLDVHAATIRGSTAAKGALPVADRMLQERGVLHGAFDFSARA
jgi:hypothetical protein